MIIFQVVAKGTNFLGNSAKTRSYKVFRTRKAAEDYQQEFKKKCETPVDDHDLGVLEDISEIKIFELELQD